MDGYFLVLRTKIQRKIQRGDFSCYESKEFGIKKLLREIIVRFFFFFEKEREREKKKLHIHTHTYIRV